MTADHRIQGISTAELAAQHGTPLYVYDADLLRDQYRSLREVLHPAVEIFYSLKANPNVAICAELRKLGSGAEVSSLVELATARRAGVDDARIIFLGPGKSREELAEALSEDGCTVVCESFGELDLCEELAREHALSPRVMLRVNPAFEVRGAGLSMGGKPRQFGMDEEQLLAVDEPAARWPSLRIVGVHAYMGTRILSEDTVVTNTEGILDLAERISSRLGFPLDVVDIGGGLGVAYFDNESDLDPKSLTQRLNPVVETFHARRPGTRVIMELGRYLTAPAGTYVMRVRYTKTSRGERFAITDGGTHHHMAAVGIGSFVKRNFPATALGRSADTETEPWNVCGPLCTPGDTLLKKASLPDLRPGDLIAIERSGAYGPSASPVFFLSHGHPAEVLVADGRAHLVRRRDTLDDLLGKQVPVDPES
ncbi:MAG: diaminopimelate decarboxylase [Streptomyces sp.]|nr:diaminopimelate decarboxylase [Streptomyces sp.]